MERHQNLVHAVTRQFCNARQVALINECKVIEQTAVVTQYGVYQRFIIGRQPLETVERILVYNETHARGILHLLDILNVAHSGEQSQSAVGLQCGAMILLAEIAQREFKGAVEAVTQRHVIVVAYLVIHLADEILRRVVVRQTACDNLLVNAAEERDGIGLLAIASCTASLLEIGLYGAWQINVHHKTHIGFIYTHTKGIGGDHHARLARLPGLFLCILALGRKAGMVILGCDAVGSEELTHLLGLLAVEGVDDCRPRYTAKDVQQFGSLVLGVAYHVGKVLAPEAHAIAVLLAEVELLLYVVDNLGSCSSRERKQWHCGEDVAQFGQSVVLRFDDLPEGFEHQSVGGLVEVPADENREYCVDPTMIPIDSIYTPIRNVMYQVEPYRVEQKTDYDRLVLEVTSDGSIHPKEALKEAAKILIYHFMLFSDEKITIETSDIDGNEEFDEEVLHMRQLLKSKLVDLNLSVRALNCLKAADVETLGQLVQYNKTDLLKFRNFGKKSLTELDDLLESLNLSFGTDISKYKLDKE